MTDSTRTCIKCGHDQGGGNFCEVCGERFPEPLPAEPPVSAAIAATAYGATAPMAEASQPARPAPMPEPQHTTPQYATSQYQGPPASGPAAPPSYTVPPAVPPAVPPRGPRDDVWSGLFDFSFHRFPTPGLVRLAWIVGVIWVALSLIVAIWVISDNWGGGLSVFLLLKSIAVAVFALAAIRLALEAALAIFRIREKKE
ncbi:MAG TPA: DUF4282 domain-containing protein [Thermoleophilia bacterium]